MGVVWTLSSDQAEQVLQLEDEEFARRLIRAFGFRLGEVTRLGERGSYPLVSSYAKNVIGPRAVLVGNAANTLHPVAGQGIQFGVEGRRGVSGNCWRGRHAREPIPEPYPVSLNTRRGEARITDAFKPLPTG